MLICILAYLALGSSPEPADPDQGELYRWFDSLGYTDLAKGDFVEIGSDDFRMWQVNYPERQIGFLTKVSPKEYRFIREDLKLEHFSATADPDSFDPKKDVKPLSFEEYCAGWRDGMQTAPSSMTHAGPRYVEPNSFFTSRVAQWRRHPDLAGECYLAARNELADNPEWKGSDADRLKQSISNHLLTNIYQDWIDPSVPKSDLALRLRVLASSLPPSPTKGEVSEDANIVDTMIREEAAHSALVKAKAHHHSKKARIQEAIWQLRNYHLYYWYIIPGPATADPTILDGIERAGYAAVPALLNALKDHRLTQAMVIGIEGEGKGWANQGHIAYHLLRVCDVAAIALHQIAHRTFADIEHWNPNAAASDAAVDDPKERARIASRANAWWRRIQAP